MGGRAGRRDAAQRHSRGRCGGPHLPGKRTHGPCQHAAATACMPAVRRPGPPSLPCMVCPGPQAASCLWPGVPGHRTMPERVHRPLQKAAALRRPQQVAGMLRLVLSPIEEELPFLTGLTLSLLDRPYLDFDIR